MNTVVIIGAGATRAEARTKQVPLRHIPPLDTDFFQLCNYHRVKENFEILTLYIKREYQLDIQKSPYPRMEEIFGLVYSDTRLKPVPSGAKEAYTALCRMYARIILETTNPLKPTTRGPISRLIRHSLNDGTCNIITFNQDIIIEKSICSISSDLLWYPDTGYAIPFSMYSVPTKKKPPLFELSSGLESKVKILKLHGSLNWYTLTRSPNLIPSTMSQSRSLRCTRNISVPPDMTFVSKGLGRKNWHTWPAIVPPVYEKGAFLNETLSPVWNAARSAIENANRIVVFGYSFPQADQQARSFFRRSIAGNKQFKSLVVINPDKAAAVVASEIFTPPIMVSTDKISHYVNSSM